MFSKLTGGGKQCVYADNLGGLERIGHGLGRFLKKKEGADGIRNWNLRRGYIRKERKKGRIGRGRRKKRKGKQIRRGVEDNFGQRGVAKFAGCI